MQKDIESNWFTELSVSRELQYWETYRIDNTAALTIEEQVDLVINLDDAELVTTKWWIKIIVL